MEALIVIPVLAVLVAVRVYASKLVAEFIEALPHAERSRMRRSLARSNC
jgi:hypothetical protein